MRLIHIAILMTCHNRRETTLRCLKSLHAAIGRVSGQGRSFDLFLVDDGSTDGTGEAIRQWHGGLPAVGAPTFNLNVIRGNGSLYWARGMRLAWERTGDQYDGYLWLNDDTVLYPEALSRLLAKANDREVLVGQLVDASGKEIYGLDVNGWVNGNFVFVPRSVARTVGMICGDYSHAWADSDYAMRVKRAGFQIAGVGIVGETEWHPLRPELQAMTLGERLRCLRDPKGWNLHDLWLYRRRNRGFLAAIFSSAHFVFHVLRGK